MASFSRVPVVDVHGDNMDEVWPFLILAMSNATFIALDTELSGLGNRKKLNAKLVEDRYRHINETAKSRSILSLGISCFQQLPSSTLPGQDASGEASTHSYIVQTFNIMLLCEDDFMVEPKSLKFLVQHGFDFNKQYEKGIFYYRGQDKPEENRIKTPRHLFAELVSMQVPIILHNGLIDLMFLYENLYTSLPASSVMFLADVSDLFPAGVVDTKYITDFEHLMSSSYLEYVFKKCQKENDRSSKKCVIHHPHYPATYTHVMYRNCSIKPAHNIADNVQAYKSALCMSYASHGWCKKTKYCPKSHNIDLIIDMDMFQESSKSRKRKRRQENREKRQSVNNSSTGNSNNISSSSVYSALCGSNSSNDGETPVYKGALSADKTDKRVKISDDVKDSSLTVDSDSLTPMDDISSDDGECGDSDEDSSKVTVAEILAQLKRDEASQGGAGHRAGYDAYMTGYIYAVYRMRGNDADKQFTNWKNKIYLVGKDYPLSITKSSFTKQSKQHLEKITKIRRTVVL